MEDLKKIKLTRRQWLKALIISILSIELMYVFTSLSKNNLRRKQNKSMYNAGKLSSFQPGQVYPFGTQKLYLSRFEDGGLLAISTRCTHLGCMVQANDNGFVCPCHASSFNQYGEVLSSPAIRALDIFPVEVEKGMVMVDLSSPIKRKGFDKSQLHYES
ncbi:MAG: Rieske (2Fe-2S) protein [Bacteroidales bacterium]|nr:Rieske (2Fe-2S) protein [Bacteroidales bacterium]MCF8458575.1 Rieske (2Fe-2S) protein [Bacteroidales bacterium]